MPDSQASAKTPSSNLVPRTFYFFVRKTVYKLTPCSGTGQACNSQEAIYTDTDLSAYVGKVILRSADQKCYTVSVDTEGHQSGGSVGVGGSYDTCGDCCNYWGGPALCACSYEEWAAWLSGEGYCPSAADLALSYRLVNYQDGDIEAGSCNNCDPAATDLDPWDGTFDAMYGFPCRWVSATGVAVDGKRLINAYIELDSISYTTWQITMFCVGYPQDLWWGRKAWGRTPVGVYTRVESSQSCTGLDSLMVEETP
jgi:hypothetical protein